MHDVAIIGGGPGGSTTANLLAREGLDVALFERERFPRFHIGESLLPFNMRLFERLGITHALGARFIEKWGVEFLSSRGDLNRLFHFDQALDSRHPKCFQVMRSEFDEVLLDAAAQQGAHVHQETRVLEARREQDGFWRIKVESAGSALREVKARFLVDASGRDGFISRLMGLRDMDPALRKAAVFAHYDGVPRRDGRDAGNIRVVLMSDGWFWFIPFADGKTSVGLVTEGSRLREQGLSPEEALDLAVERCPAARDLMSSARRVSPVYAASDWTYACRRAAGDGWLMVGDSAAFIDPVFSSGVWLAMSSGEMAARTIASGLRAGDLSAHRFAAYEKKVRRHVHAYYRMVRLFYGPAFAGLCFFPGTKLGISGAVINLLAGDIEPSLAVRWRLEFFYFIGWLNGRYGLGERVDLHRVFEKREVTRVSGAAAEALAR